MKTAKSVKPAPRVIRVGPEFPHKFDATFSLGKPYENWSDVPVELFPGLTTINDTTLFRHRDRVLAAQAALSGEEFLLFIKLAVQIPAIGPDVRGWIWFPCDGLNENGFAYCRYKPTVV